MGAERFTGQPSVATHSTKNVLAQKVDQPECVGIFLCWSLENLFFRIHIKNTKNILSAKKLIKIVTKV